MGVGLLRLLRFLCFSMLVLFTSTIAMAEDGLIVVANIKESNVSLSKQQIRGLFMGSSVGYDFKVVTLPPSSLTRVTFNTKIIGLTEARIQSYWAQMRFSGRKTEPRVFTNEDEIIDYLLNTEGAVAYLSASTIIPKSLKVIYRIDSI